MTLTDISNIRLFSQRIARTEFKTPKEIVSWMGAMQAQDYLMSKWAIGTRLLNSTKTTVEDAIDKGDIIRTHLMRPTWHYISADDIYWILELTAPQIKSSIKSRNRNLELTEDVIVQGNQLIENVVSKGINVTREDIAIAFNNAKIRTNENRLAHFLLLAELDGIICSGITVKTNGRASLTTYALLSERVPEKNSLTREESLAELAKRYFTSHGPATIQDFEWWSGLSLRDARTGLESVKSHFISEAFGSEEYWFANSFGEIGIMPSVHLLPSYDEFLISYRNRSASLPLAYNKKTVSDNGIFRPVIVVNGLVAGLWKRTLKKNTVNIELEMFQLNSQDNVLSLLENEVEEEIMRYGHFINKKCFIV